MKDSAPGQTRTDTEWILSPLPLPLGYRGWATSFVATQLVRDCPG